MSDDLVPPSPTSLLESSQKRDKRLLSHRHKLIKLNRAENSHKCNTDEIVLSGAKSIDEGHRLFNDDDDDDDESACSQTSNDSEIVNHDGTKKRSLDTQFGDNTQFMAVLGRSEDDSILQPTKRFKYDDSAGQLQGRRLSYDSDTRDSITIGHNTSDEEEEDSDSVTSASKLDASINDIVLSARVDENIHELSDYYQSQKELSIVFEFEEKYNDRLAEGALIEDYEDNKLIVAQSQYIHNRDSPDLPADGFQFGGEVPANAYLGFQTAKGVRIDVDPAKQLDLFGDRSPEVDPILTGGSSSPLKGQAECPPDKHPQFVGFTTAGGGAWSKLSDSDLQRARQWEAELEQEVARSCYVDKEEDTDEPLPPNIAHELEAQKRQGQLCEASAFQSPAKSNGMAKMSTPLVVRPTESQEVSAAVSAVMQDTEFLDEKIFFRNVTESDFGPMFGCSQAPSPIVPSKDSVPSKRMHFHKNARRHMLRREIVKQLDRRKELEERLNDWPNKNDALKKPFVSEFIQKKLSKGKYKLRDFLPMPVVDRNVERSPPNIDFQHLIDFKFDVLNWILCNEDVTNYYANGLPVDHFLVLINEQFHVGFEEIQVAFYNAQGIDPNLVSQDWIRNAFELIVLKLASMDRMLSGAGYLTLANVLHSLHYRYHIEVDCCRRSVLRKCLEKDECPSNPMILFVKELREDSIVLCDGYYSIETRIDQGLEEQIERHRILPGTKVITFGAELVNLDQGYAPLEVPNFVKLKISGNSTRRCRWDARLGRYFGGRCLDVPLSKVLANGGQISRMRLRVLRKYPLLFWSDNAVRNERMEERYQQATRLRRMELAEQLRVKVQAEMELEELENRTEERSSRNGNLKEVTEPEELYQLVEFAADPAALESQLSNDQRQDLERFRSRVAAQNNEQLELRINRQLQELDDEETRSTLVLLKLKVSDPGQLMESTTGCAELTIKRPSEDLIGSCLKEGCVLDVRNVIATGIRNGLLSLSTGWTFLWAEVKSSPSESGHKKPLLQRQLTRLDAMLPLSDFRPPFSEFDTVAIVVKVAQRCGADKFQHVFGTDAGSADAATNVICLNFWNGTREYGYEDLVRPGAILHFKDLQWRKSNSYAIPNGYVTDVTTITRCTGGGGGSGSVKRSDVEREMAECAARLDQSSVADLLSKLEQSHPFLRNLPSVSELTVPQSPACVGRSTTGVGARGRASLQSPAPNGLSPILNTPYLQRQINRLDQSSNGTNTSVGNMPSPSVSGLGDQRYCTRRLSSLMPGQNSK